MRDIRSDLLERLQNVKAERIALEGRLEAVNRKEQALTALIEQEDSTWSPQQALKLVPEGAADQGDTVKRSELGSVLIEALSDGHLHALDDLKVAAMRGGVAFGNKKPGRVIHFALLGMAQNGAVEAPQKGFWRLKNGEHSPNAANGALGVGLPTIRPIGSNGNRSKSRKEEVAEIINQRGPVRRAELVAAGIPLGTVNFCLRDRNMFMSAPGGRWGLRRSH